MKLTEPQLRLERRLGHAFARPELLAQALTHRSASPLNNERLEFLGDAVLNLAAAAALYRSLPQAGEGDLSRLRASLVCEDSLARLAEEVGVSDALILGPGELKSGGFRRASILADTLEALLGAIQLDGGLAAAEAACQRLLEQPLRRLPDPATLKDSKTRLQEALQARGRPLPQYELVSAEGPPHAQTFQVSCRLADGPQVTQGQGGSRRAAEQAAAEKMIGALGDA